jgi:pimeloyl-ACP methyl ester carboxylesterase
VGALLPDLVTGVAAICSLAPRDGSGLDYLAGMQDDIAQIHRWFDHDLDAVGRWATSYRTEVEGYSAEQIEQLAAAAFPADATSRDFLRANTESVQSALVPGTDGLIDDGIALHDTWGFEVGAIGVPVQFWSGPTDIHVPLAHSRWLAAQLPGAPLDALGRGGHLEIIASTLPVAHGWLAGLADRDRS